jgi:hypothetical protein
LDPYHLAGILEWTRSHPERRLALEDIEQWTYKDKDIYAADVDAEFGELNRSGLPVCTFVELAILELVDALIPEGSWYWREDNGEYSLPVSIIIVNVCFCCAVTPTGSSLISG